MTQAPLRIYCPSCKERGINSIIDPQKVLNSKNTANEKKITYLCGYCGKFLKLK